MKIVRHIAKQGHPVPDRVTAPRGPFPQELLAEPEIVYDYDSAYAEDGGDFSPGATSQNNFRPMRNNG